jgi:mRNA interferase RelE/StbE
LAYDVRIAPAAERAIGKLSPGIQGAVLDKIAELGREPRPADCRKIRALPARYEVYRVEAEGTHRILYQIKDETAWILVVKVADRKDVYKRISDLKGLLE